MQVRRKIADYFRVDKELIIVFLLVAIAGFIFFFVSNQTLGADAPLISENLLGKDH